MSDNIIEFNKNQTWSQTDDFTIERYRQIASYLRKDTTSILEIGCNTGRGGKVLREIFPKSNLVGVDIVKSRLEKIKPSIYNLLTDKDVTQWSNDEKFDCIIAAEVIEHIPKSDFRHFLFKCKELLNDNGKIVFTTPNPNSILVKLGRKAVFKDPSHINIMSVYEFKCLVKASGLKVEKIVGTGKMTRYMKNIPVISLYGSYLSILKK